MDIILHYMGIIYALFLLGYWASIAILLYHLKRFGIGGHVTKILYIIVIGSILLTCITTAFYIKL